VYLNIARRGLGLRLKSRLGMFFLEHARTMELELVATLLAVLVLMPGKEPVE
jgi:hypothetical protein